MTQFDVAGLGNAIVDILAYTDEKFLRDQGLAKGAMTLIDQKRAQQLYDLMGSATECSGGSAANTIAGIASLGGKAAFIGKVADDQLGTTFRYDMKSIKVEYTTESLAGSLPTACCLIFVTGDERAPGKKSEKAERTMATYLGATTKITEKDIDENIIKNSKITYLEGYLWDQEAAKAAINKAIDIAHANDRKVSFTLSDSFCVDRHRSEFMDLVRNKIDILFANEHEISSLFQETDLKKIYSHMAGMCEVTVITRSEKGSSVITKDDIHFINSEPTHVYDVTGAGDIYASGFLYGYVNNFELPKCGRLAAISAAEVLKYLGGRPLTKLSELLRTL